MQVVCGLQAEEDRQQAEDLARSLSLKPLTGRILFQRGIRSDEEARLFLFPKLEDLAPPEELPGLREAKAVVEKAIETRSRILIHGDYDVDGVTASALLARTLKCRGADFRVFLPHRVRDGYGFTEAGIRAAVQAEARLIITVDCGITAFDTVRKAREQGIEVIVTDHHQLSPRGVPPGATILHSLAGEGGEPFKELTAVGVVFKLAQAILGKAAYPLLDLVALGTVADLSALRGENRILVKWGLQKIDEGANLGLKALRKVAGLKSRRTTMEHLGFVLGPRINASGRVDSAWPALYLLVSENEREAESLARILEEENRTRQSLERKALSQAVEKVEREINFNQDRVIVIWSRNWHPGVIGIMAARLVDRYNRPSIVISLDEHFVGKGSGRSIKGFNLFEGLRQVESLLVEFGGHEQAAGLKIEEKQLEAFRKKINQVAREAIDPSDLVRSFTAELEVERLQELTGSFLHELELLEPFGPGNPKPIFLTRNLLVKRPAEPFGRGHLRFWVEDGETILEAVWYNARVSELPRDRKVDLIYTPTLKSWQGREFVVLEVKHFEEAGNR